MREGAAVHVGRRGLGAESNASAGGSRPAWRLGKGAGHSDHRVGVVCAVGVSVGWAGKEARRGHLEGIGQLNQISWDSGRGRARWVG